MRKAGTRLTWAGNAGALGLTSLVPARMGWVPRDAFDLYLAASGMRQGCVPTNVPSGQAQSASGMQTAALTCYDAP